jgi:hypothetical protein
MFSRPALPAFLLPFGSLGTFRLFFAGLPCFSPCFGAFFSGFLTTFSLAGIAVESRFT